MSYYLSPFELYFYSFESDYFLNWQCLIDTTWNCADIEILGRFDGITLYILGTLIG